MGSWIKSNAATAAVVSLAVATLGIGALVLLARNISDVGDLAYLLIPLMVVVGFVVTGSVVTLAAVGLTAIAGKESGGAPTPGPPH